MKKAMVSVLVLVASVVLAACGPTAPAATPTSAGDAAVGKQKFLGTCVSCHGPDAKGLPGLGKNLNQNTFIQSQTDEQMLAFVKKGRPASDPANTTKVDMPPRGGNPALSDKDLTDIIAFLRTLQK